VPREISHHPRPEGHVPIPAAAIGGLSVTLAAGLALLGPLARLDQMVATWFSRGGLEKFPKHLPGWSIWLMTAVFAFGLAYAMLNTPGTWRRVLLWITALTLIASWAPVLSLAAHAPEITAAWVATLWSGVCALVYTTHHRMPCDPSPTLPHDPR
jgi:hypothetical protein